MGNISKDKAVKILTKLGITGLKRAVLNIEFNYCEYSDVIISDKKLTESIDLIRSIVESISIGPCVVDLTDIEDPIL